VNCGQLKDALDPDTERQWYEKKFPIYQGRLGLEDYRPFNLAVILLDEWPNSEMDSRSMQYFGRRVMSTWGLNPIYNGVDSGMSATQHVYTWDEYQQNCPTTALLIILPKFHQAFLSSPSCEFICASRGGPEVIAETLAALEKHGPAAAVVAGIAEIDRVLKETVPLSLKKMPSKTLIHNGRRYYRKYSDADSVFFLRMVYALIVLTFVFAIVSFVYYVLLAPSKRQPRALTQAVGEDGRQAVREAYIAEAHDRAQQARALREDKVVREKGSFTYSEWL
jgi:hypothetical protein